MNKILTSIFLVIIFVLASVICVGSVSNYDLSELTNCRYLYTDNNNNGSYIYGYNQKTLYSAQVIPDVKIRYVSYNGVVRCVCHNGVNTYALFETNTATDTYVLAQINMNSGSCTYYTFSNLEHFDNSSIAVADNEVFFMRTDSHYSYVTSYSFSGEKLYEYRFDDEVSDLFVNNSKAYARLYSGDIYRLSNGTYTYCAKTTSQSVLCNGGKGFVYTDYGKIISLENNTTVSSPFDCAVYDNTLYHTDGKSVVNNEKYYDFSDDISLLLVNDNKIAVMLSDYSCKVIDKSELKEYKSDFTINTTEIPYIINDNAICAVESSTTVTEFKKNFSTDITIYNANGNKVTSGLVKTGYRTFVAGKTYDISVRGDITGEGNVKSNDISTLMSVFTQKTQISGVYFKSADFDLNGEVNNKDLVLIAQKYESEK